MGADFADTLTGGEVCYGEGVVCGDGVDYGGEEGPLEVDDGGFVETGEEAVVCVGGVGPPEGFRRSEDMDMRRWWRRERETYKRRGRQNMLLCFGRLGQTDN